MKRLLLLTLTMISIHTIYAQDQPTPVAAADIKKMATDKKFKFIPKVATLDQSADQATAASISSNVTQDNRFTLTANYYAVLTPDSVASYLPYYDKSNTVAVGSSSSTTLEEDPNRFLATAYDYQVKDKKNGSEVITIKLKDGSKITKYNFDLQPDGKAKLEVTIENYKIVKYEGTFTAL